MEPEFSYKIETSNSFIDYVNNIIYVRVKEGIEITIPSMQEQYLAQNKLVGNDKYAVLVDASKNSNPTKDAREYMANYNPKNRVATAILTNKNLAVILIANFYLKFNNPLIHAKIFNNEEDAVIWLKEQLTH